MNALEIIRSAPAEPCHPCPRYLLPPESWNALLAALGSTASPELLALWADTVQVHALFRGPAHQLALASTGIEEGKYPALSPVRPTAALFERMVQDLWGHVAQGAADIRPWVDHGHWPYTQPLAPRPGPPAVNPEPPEFRPTPGLMQVPIGPIEGLIGEPAHLRLATYGEEVRRAECRLGYAHKGVLSLMRGKSPRNAVRFAARLSGDTTVAHSLAFAHAAEAATGSAAPPRAAALRLVMTHVECAAYHLDALALVADAFGDSKVFALCGRHIELLRRAAAIAFGHRLMMDLIVPGGLVADIAPGGQEAVLEAASQLCTALPALRRLLQAQRFRLAGDSWSRMGHSLAELTKNLRLLANKLDALSDGEIAVPIPSVSGEGLGMAEAGRGEIWHWLRLDHGQIAAVFCCDPGWALWPLAEAAMAKSNVDDVAVIRASFGLAVSGVDL
ncbi:MAG: hypothetical protein JO227_01910 [Acetobacteraceae bacterium]|nr:hypothetical protein [Acetobacteraceae bacterium]